MRQMRHTMMRIAVALGFGVAATVVLASGAPDATARPNDGGGGGAGCVACQYDSFIHRHSCEPAYLFGCADCMITENWACAPSGSCAQTTCKGIGTRCGVFYPSLNEVPLL